jgi:hypothetical protein
MALYLTTLAILKTMLHNVVIYECVWSIGGMIMTGEVEVLAETPAQMPLFSP